MPGWNDGRITPEALVKLKARLGVERLKKNRPWNKMATEDTIYHFAIGIGDDNPLWCDPDHAAKTRYGGIIAPPTFPYSCAVAEQEGLPGVPGIFASDEWELFQPVRCGDAVTTVFSLVKLEEKESFWGGRGVDQVTRYDYRNQRGETVARRHHSIMRIEAETARRCWKYMWREKHRTTDEELQRVFDSYAQEKRCGATPRYWEDVQEGEELPPITKGPFTISTFIFALGGIGMTWVASHRMLFDVFRRHPATMARNPETGAPELPAAIHWVDSLAREIGAPAAYEGGPERVSWLAQVLTDWMGDDGTLKRLYVEIRRFCIVGDTTWCHGRVVRKYTQDGEGRVDCDLWAVNQLGEETARAQGTVALPRRGS